MTIALGILVVIMETIIQTRMNAYVDLQSSEGAAASAIATATSSFYNEGGDGDSDSDGEGDDEGEARTNTKMKMKTGETETESKTSTSSSPQKPLQFLHIPKNAGSAITDSAIENGIVSVNNLLELGYKHIYIIYIYMLIKKIYTDIHT